MSNEFKKEQYEANLKKLTEQYEAEKKELTEEYEAELKELEEQNEAELKEVDLKTLKRWEIKELDISSILQEGNFPEFILNNKIKFLANESDKRDCTVVLKFPDNKYFAFYFDMENGVVDHDKLVEYKQLYDSL